MNAVPLIASNPSVIKIVSSIISGFPGEQVETICLKETRAAMEYMTIEMPDLIFLDFSSPDIDAHELMSTIMSDAWLLHAGIIAFCKSNKDTELIESIKGANLIIALNLSELKTQLPKILSIIFNNRRILFQRFISSDLIENFSGSFKIENDPYAVRCYVNLICNFLYNSNRLSIDRKYGLKLALTEMLMNAIEHGNCDISYQEKSVWLQKNGDILELIRQKLEEPAFASRSVTFEYTLTSSKAAFFIADEGSGFDWKATTHSPENEKDLFELHGRGILITRAVVQNLTYNEKGNEVTFEIDFANEKADLRPGLFNSIPSFEISKGSVIFREGERSNFLYYIVEGRYGVFVGEKQVSSLSPDDIFMGEMSFLLNNHRSATVIAECDGKLIQISKKDFVEAIKSRPHYALFLCRLLAQRIQRVNLLSSEIA